MKNNALEQKEKYSPRIIIAATLLIGILFYWRGLFIQPSGDDWLLIAPVLRLLREHGFWGAFVGIFTTRVGDLYRPLPLLAMFPLPEHIAMIQTLRLIATAAFFLLTIRAGQWLGLSRWAAALTASMVILHQVFASVNLQMDLWGDLLAAAACVALLIFCARYEAGGSLRSYVSGTLLVTAGCLLAKEAGVSYFLIPLLWYVLRPLPTTATNRRGHLYATASALVPTLAYLVLRHAIGLHYSGVAGGYYDLQFGFNLVKNTGLGLVALLTPVNTVRIALDGILWKALGGLWVIIIIGFAIAGFWQARRTPLWRMIVFLLATAVVVQGPVFFMPHLTEANFTRSLAPGWIAIAFCISAGWTVYRRSPVYRASLTALVGLWFVFNLWAVKEKTADIMRGHARAAHLRQEVQRFLPEGADSTILFAVLDKAKPGYSVYRQPLLDDIRNGEIPLGVAEAVAPHTLRSEFITVTSSTEAHERRASFLVLDNGSLTDLR